MKRLASLLLLALVAGLLSSAVAVVAGAPASYAAAGADCSGLTAKQATRVATGSAAVFEGQVSLPKHVNPDKPLRLQVQVLVAWSQGVTVPSTATVTVAPGACRDWMLAHRSPEDYLFFAQQASGGWSIPGDAPRMVPRSSRIVAALGQPVAGGTTTATPVSFTDTHATPPRSLKKVAAPGVALLIIGALGLLVVGRLGRR